MPSDVRSSRKRPAPLVVLSGGLVSHVHTVMGFIAFFGALVTALSLHYHKVVKNHVAQYPDEWWPSVSATIGDWYPERNIFQVGIALMAGPRFALVFLSALLVSLSTPSRSTKASVLLFVGVLRTLACGGWVYVTSTDDHLFHDIAMFVYLALTLPWMFITSGSLAQPSLGSGTATPTDKLAAKARRMRRIACFSFFACTPFMGFFFYRHNALRIPGAYSYYAYFEWGLIIFVSLNILTIALRFPRRFTDVLSLLPDHLFSYLSRRDHRFTGPSLRRSERIRSFALRDSCCRSAFGASSGQRDPAERSTWTGRPTSHRWCLDSRRQAASYRRRRVVSIARHRCSFRWVRSFASVMTIFVLWTYRYRLSLLNERSLTEPLSICSSSLYTAKCIPIRPVARGLLRLWSDSQPSVSQKQLPEDDDSLDAAFDENAGPPSSPTSLRAIISLISDSYLGTCDSNSDALSWYRPRCTVHSRLILLFSFLFLLHQTLCFVCCISFLLLDSFDGIAPHDLLL